MVDVAEWKGEIVTRHTFRSRTKEELRRIEQSLRVLALRKKLGTSQTQLPAELNAPPCRCGVYTDPSTGRVLGSRTWAYFTKFAASDPDGVQMNESAYYYDPRPDDSQFFDVERIQRGTIV